MKGDILFFSNSNGAFDDAIKRWTNGPYTHVEIDCGDGTSIGALAEGIKHHAAPQYTAIAHTSTQIPEKRIDIAMVWLEQQVGKRYGWDDIFNDFVAKFLPNGPFVTVSQHYDCSDLASRFLTYAWFPITSRMMDFTTVSPNDLARELGALVEVVS